MPSPSADSSLSTSPARPGSRRTLSLLPGARSLMPEGQLGRSLQRKACRARLCRPKGRSRYCERQGAQTWGARLGLNLQPHVPCKTTAHVSTGKMGHRPASRSEGGTATCTEDLARFEGGYYQRTHGPRGVPAQHPVTWALRLLSEDEKEAGVSHYLISGCAFPRPLQTGSLSFSRPDSAPLAALRSCADTW